MDERVKEAFGQLRAEECLKEGTRAYLRQVRAGRRAAGGRRMAAAAACMVLVLAGLVGYRVYFTPTSAISIDINPSVELGINRFDKVVSVQSYNQAGQALVDSIDLRFLDYREALEQVLSSQSVAERLDQGQLLSITVIGEDGAQCSRILAGAQACAAGRENVCCGQGDAQLLEEAHHAGLSFGKYQAYLELQALDPDVTAEEAAGMTMRQIRDRIAALSGAETAQQGGHGAHHGWGAERKE